MNTRFFLLTILPLFLLFISCEPTEAVEPPMTDTQQLRNLVSDFKVETGIEIFYQSGNGDLQNRVESDHGIQDNDYIQLSASEMLARVTKFIELLDEYPNDFIDDLNLDAILMIDTSQPNWLGHAVKQQYSSIAFDGIEYWDNRTLIAHEIFHIFDPGLPLFVPSSQYETSWSQLNPPNFEYGNGCEIVSGLTSNYSLGFINSYARCTPGEDRAIVFSFLFSKNDELQNFRDMDSYLESKATFIEESVKEYGFQF